MHEQATTTVKPILSKEINFLTFFFSFQISLFLLETSLSSLKIGDQKSLLNLTFWALVRDSCTSAGVIGICAFTEDKRLEALLLTKCPKYPSSPTKVQSGPNNTLLSIFVKSYQAGMFGGVHCSGMIKWHQTNETKDNGQHQPEIKL